MLIHGQRHWVIRPDRIDSSLRGPAGAHIRRFTANAAPQTSGKVYANETSAGKLVFALLFDRRAKSKGGPASALPIGLAQRCRAYWLSVKVALSGVSAEDGPARIVYVPGIRTIASFFTL